MAPRFTGTATDPRRRLLEGQAETLSDAGLLSVLIDSPNTDCVATLLNEHPIPDGLWRISAEDLFALDGVGPAAAARVLACLEM